MCNGVNTCRLTFLGTGTSTGVPVVGCQCDVCRSADPRDKRCRTSVMLESDTTRIIIDCGPDFRQQMLRVPYRKIDGVLLTHIHYDHVGGLDDLRPFCSFGSIDVYADTSTVSSLHHTMPYVFAKHLYPGVPRLELKAIQPHRQFQIGDIPVIPFVVMHHALPIMAYRFGRFAYITDMKTIDDTEREYLHGIDTLVVNALRFGPGHHSHMRSISSTPHMISDCMTKQTPVFLRDLSSPMTVSRLRWKSDTLFFLVIITVFALNSIPDIHKRP